MNKNMETEYSTYLQQLSENGYCIIPNILSKDEIQKAKDMFYAWKDTIPNHDFMHRTCDPHGIYKFHEVGHQRHAWYIRTRPNVQRAFKQIWKTDKLICSFDGSCYISKDNKQKDKSWIHTDQAPNTNGFQCVQGFVSLTDNSERTLVVYDKSHSFHRTYFDEKDIKSSKNWTLIDTDTLENMKSQRRVLNVPAGSLVLWDSRSFHSNQYGLPNSEERIVQYVCYLPKSHPKNTPAMIKKRRKYFEERRTTSHWPAPIRVNGLQPRTFGDSSRNIDYSTLILPNLDDMRGNIDKLL